MSSIKKRHKFFAIFVALLIPGLAFATTARFTLHNLSVGDNTHATVRDHQTHLEWQQEGSSDMHSWSAALGYCELLQYGGYDDWRLPNVSELVSLIDDQKEATPAINTIFFSNDFNSGTYWTSTTNPHVSSNAYVINFYDSGDTHGRGGVKNEAKSGSKRAVCIRSW